MIKITEKKRCCGCSACKNACPVNAIEMKADEEGFLYPNVDIEKYIQCGLCEKVCPVLNNEKYKKSEISPKAYIFRVNDKETLRTSNSGGFFTPISEYVLKNNGVVFGVGYDKDFKVIHKMVEEKSKIKELTGSKYVQSDIGDKFKKAKEYLMEGKLVLFSGTPCQIAGLKSFLVKDYENLITVDVVCHGTPSPELWKKYIEYQEKKYKSKLKEARFRNKTYGYHSATMKLVFENNKEYYGSARIDYMLKGFYEGICSRPSCYDCAFKSRTHCSDFTIFDSWNINKLVPNLKDDNKGYTNVFVNSKKGLELMNELKGVTKYEVDDIDKMIKLDGKMVENCKIPNKNRKEFYRELNEKNYEDVMKKFLKVTYKDYLLEKSKAILYKLNIIGYVKKIKMCIKKEENGK